MKPFPLRKVVILTSTFTVIIGFFNFIIGRFKPDWLYSYQWLLVFYFYLITMISLLTVEYTAGKNTDNIAKGFFGAMMFRLFISILIAVVVIYLDRDSSTIFAVNFIVLYLLYLGFEIYYLIANLQPRLNRDQELENEE